MKVVKKKYDSALLPHSRQQRTQVNSAIPTMCREFTWKQFPKNLFAGREIELRGKFGHLKRVVVKFPDQSKWSGAHFSAAVKRARSSSWLTGPSNKNKILDPIQCLRAKINDLCSQPPETDVFPDSLRFFPLFFWWGRENRLRDELISAARTRRRRRCETMPSLPSNKCPFTSFVVQVEN